MPPGRARDGGELAQQPVERSPQAHAITWVENGRRCPTACPASSASFTPASSGAIVAVLRHYRLGSISGVAVPGSAGPMSGTIVPRSAGPISGVTVPAAAGPISGLALPWSAGPMSGTAVPRSSARSRMNPARTAGRGGCLDAPVPAPLQPHLAGPRRGGGRPDGAERLVLHADAAPLRRQRPQRPRPQHLRPHHDRPAVTRAMTR
jgi:hypothetical protein